ncbi:11966_t:CDS:10, partial [Acaulospora morrowiae]
MRINKYESVPSKESDVEYGQNQTRDLNDTGETSENLWMHDAKESQETEVHETMETDERETMFKEKEEDDTIVDVETWDEDVYTKSDRNERKIIPCLIIAGIFVLAWIGSAILYEYYRSGSVDQSTLSRIKFDDIYNGSFYPTYTSLVWSTSDGDDGQFIYQQTDNSIVVEHIADKSKKTLVDGKDLGELTYFSFDVSPDNQYVLLGTNKTKLWRHSYTANYFIFNVSSKLIFPITTPIDTNHQAVISYAKWSPVGHSLAFVKDNDVYVSVGLTEERRITYDGSTVIFNGVPDWIYEEEVLATNFALWWSPDATYIAYIRLNETDVPEYRFPLYLNGMEAGPYVTEVVMKYPKPGYPNPIVTFHIYDVSKPLVSQSAAIPFTDDFSDDNKIITEVCWAGSDKALVRVMDRVQDTARVVLVDTVTLKGTTVREENADATDGGWHEITRSMIYLKKFGSLTQDAYLDIVVNNGYNHLALFSPIDSNTPQFLTSGNWEVVGGVQAVDYKRELVYFISTEKSSIERHLYSVTLDGKNKTALTDTSSAGYYSVSFSKDSEYYNIMYQGPDIPWQKVLKTDNKKLNVMEIRPPGMDESGREKYPVLFRVYGGPTSQLVSKKFLVDWHMFLASSPKLKYIVVVVDTRGTGYKGRNFRVCVRKHLGEFEANDTINTARYWSKLPYVNSSKMAVWGWSFGGFLTTKVIEANSGVFQAGIAVAPVTDWRFYDSIYTERYMKSPDTNAEGYQRAAVTNMTGFKNAKFLLVHGTGDVHNYRVQFYTDSDHSMTKHNANRE